MIAHLSAWRRSSSGLFSSMKRGFGKKPPVTAEISENMAKIVKISCDTTKFVYFAITTQSVNDYMKNLRFQTRRRVVDENLLPRHEVLQRRVLENNYKVEVIHAMPTSMMNESKLIHRDLVLNHSSSVNTKVVAIKPEKKTLGRRNMPMKPEISVPIAKFGQIYRLYCKTSGKQFYGYTTSSLASTRKLLLTMFNCYHLGTSTHHNTSFEIFEGKNFDIATVEEFGCVDRSVLQERRKFYIWNNPCVNKTSQAMKTHPSRDPNLVIKFTRHKRTLASDKIFKSAHIYKLRCPDTGYVCYGSTVSKINKNEARLKSRHKAYLDGKRKFIAAFRILENEAYIYIYTCKEIIEDCTMLDLRLRVGEYIEQDPDCINIISSRKVTD
jgi:hypothetical protein